jgi:outer membrane protein OmpA-like peptidoglycan-associated protein
VGRHRLIAVARFAGVRPRKPIANIRHPAHHPADIFDPISQIDTGAVMRYGLFSFAVLAILATPSWAAPLTLHPGLTMTTTVYDGRTSNGDRLGDYETVNTVTQVANGGYTYSFRFIAGDKSHGLSPNSGTQTVFPEDNKHAALIREFWPSGDLTAKGYLGSFRLSDDVFKGIKSGKDTKLEYDAADSPKSVRKTGEEDLTVLVNERPTKLHTIVVQSPAGGKFWILDNPGFSTTIKGEAKWKWMVTAISDSGVNGGAVVAALKTSGEATTHAILFGIDSANVDSTAKPVLDSVAQYLKANPAIRLEVQGHTDSIGGAAPNLALSQGRADAVKQVLVADGVSADRLIAKGYGLKVPIADNAAPEGRARNRRVVFKLL